MKSAKDTTGRLLTENKNGETACLSLGGEQALIGQTCSLSAKQMRPFGIRKNKSTKRLLYYLDKLSKMIKNNTHVEFDAPETLFDYKITEQIKFNFLNLYLFAFGNNKRIEPLIQFLEYYDIQILQEKLFGFWCAIDDEGIYFTNTDLESLCEISRTRLYLSKYISNKNLTLQAKSLFEYMKNYLLLTSRCHLSNHLFMECHHEIQKYFHQQTLKLKIKLVNVISHLNNARFEYNINQDPYLFDSVAQHFEEVFPQIRNQIFNFNVKHEIDVESVTTLINNLKETFYNQLKGQFEKAKPVITEIVIICLVFFITDQIIKRFNLNRIKPLLNALSIVITLILTPTLASQLKNIFKQLLEYVPDIDLPTPDNIFARAQVAGEGEAKLLGLAALSAITLLTGTPVNASVITRQVAMLPRFTAGITSIWEVFDDVLGIIRKHILHGIFGYELTETEDPDKDVNRFNKLLSILIEAQQKGTLISSSIMQQRLQEAEMLGLKLIQSKGLGEIRSSINTQYGLLRKIIDEAGLKGITTRGNRIPPVIIQLYGRTEQGKSTMITTLVLKLLKKIADEEGIELKDVELQDLFYARNVEQEFYDGYRQQLICVFDDFGQLRDSTTEPNPEFMEVIRTGNTFEYNLHMAKINEKDNTRFVSRIVILTTNAKKPQIESLICPEAFYRRIDCPYEVRFKEDRCYETQQGQRRRLRPEFTTTYDPNNQEFLSFDIETEKHTDESPKTLDDVVEEAFGKYKRRFQFEKTRQEYDRKLADSLGYKSVRNQMFGQTGRIFDLATAKYDNYLKPGTLLDKVQDFKARTTNNVSFYFQQLRTHMESIEYAEKLKQWKMKIKEIWSKHKPILLALSFLGITLGTVALAKSYFGQQETITDERYNPGPRTKRERYNGRAIVRREVKYAAGPNRTSKFHKELKAQSEVLDKNGLVITSSLARSSIYCMELIDDGHTRQLGSCIFVRGRVMLLPLHFIHHLEHCETSTAVIKISSCCSTKNISYTMTLSDFLNRAGPLCTDENIDLAYAIFTTAHDHKDITHHLSTEEEQRKMTDIAINRVGYRFTDNSTILSTFHTDAHHITRRFPEQPGATINVPYDNPDGTIDKTKTPRKMTDYWRYTSPTTEGDCGSIILANNKMVVHKILGMHVCGVSGQDDGYSTPIYKEDILCLLDQVEKEFKIAPPICDIKAEAQKLRYVGESEIIGYSKEIHRTPPKTKLKQSPLHPDQTDHAWRESVKLPAILGTIKVRENENIEPNEPDGKFNPKRYRLEKVCKPALHVDETLLREIRESYCAELDELMIHNSSDYKSLYTFEEAVLGIAGNPYLNSINRSTAAGYGWTPQKGKTGKQTWFGSDAEFDLHLAGPVKERIQLAIDQAKQGNRIQHIFIDTLKDELKPIHKRHKPRVFSACAQDYYILCRMFFMGATAWLTANRIDTGIAVGTNAYSSEWDKIVRHLHRCSEKIAAGDFEGFDATQTAQGLSETCEILNHLSQQLPGYEPWHDDIRRLLYRDMVNSYHCDEDIIWMWTHSLPSGTFLTAMGNSLYLVLMIRYVFARCLTENGIIKWTKHTKQIQTLRTYLRRLKVMTYGDDNLIALPDEFIDIFNQNTLPKLFQEIGMIYTDEDKQENVNIPDYRPIQQVSFLKRSFRVEPQLGRFVGPLTLDTVLETPYWLRSCVNENEIVKSNVEWAVAELALHDQGTFTYWTKKIRLGCKAVLNWMPGLLPSRVEYIQKLENLENELQQQQEQEGM